MHTQCSNIHLIHHHCRSHHHQIQRSLLLMVQRYRSHCRWRILPRCLHNTLREPLRRLNLFFRYLKTQLSKVTGSSASFRLVTKLSDQQNCLSFFQGFRKQVLKAQRQSYFRQNVLLAKQYHKHKVTYKYLDLLHNNDPV